MWRLCFSPWVGKIPWRKAWQPTPIFLPGYTHGQRRLADLVHRTAKSWTQLKLLSTHAHVLLKNFLFLTLYCPAAYYDETVISIFPVLEVKQECLVSTHCSQCFYCYCNSSHILFIDWRGDSRNKFLIKNRFP